MTDTSTGEVSDPYAAQAWRAHELLQSEPTPQTVEELRTLAGKGSASGMRLLAWAYVNGNGIGVDFAQAEHWFRQSYAQGEPLALYDLGQLYQRQTRLPVCRRDT
ncbi:MAG: hypothetical protein ACYCXT_07830 [Acidiferrobacteraceae bacterium]